MTPEDPLVDDVLEPSIVIPTIGFCRDIDIRDSLLVAATDENGYFIATIDDNLNYTILHEFSYDPQYQANQVHISEKYNYFLVLDTRDAIYKVNFSDTDTSFTLNSPDSGNRPDDTRSFVIDESNEDYMMLYSLWIESDHSEIYERKYWYENTSNPDSVVFFNFLDAESHQDTYNSNAQELYLKNSLLSIANSQLGVIVLKQDENGDLSELTRFDTPITGEVETIFSTENTVFSGLSYSVGCYAVELDTTTGEIISNTSFAQGYSVKGINAYDDIIALTCGYDGVLIYKWDSTLDSIKFVTKLDSGYAYKAKVIDNNVFVATRNGIEIFEIER